MKSIILSCTPFECEKIVNGDMSILVRKVVPKEVPFKIYIYETKGNKIECGFHLEDTGITLRERYVYGMHKAKIVKHYRYEGKSQVIGEFTCDKVDIYNYHKGLTRFGGELGLPIGTYDSYLIFEDDYKAMCLSYDEVKDYGNGKPLYGLHISDLKIFDEPKELSEFKTGCIGCKDRDTYHCKFYCCMERPITRPPKNYIYVNDLGE